jgi:hypothetical protein
MSDEKGNRVDNLKLKIDEKGNIIDAKENGKDLEYGSEETKRMDDGSSHVDSNPCRWRKIGGKWRCI